MKKVITLYIIIILALIVGIVEIVGHLLHPKGVLTTISYNPHTGWRYRTGMDLKIGDSRFATNPRGFRDRDHPLAKPNNTVRILLLGDSYAAGIGFEPYPVLLEKYLNSSENDSRIYEVINSSVSAWATDQQYIYLREEGVFYRPDIVILNTVPNDIKEIYTRGTVRLKNKEYTERGFPALSPLKRLFWYLSGHSYIFQIFQGVGGSRYGYFDGLDLHPWWKGGLSYTELFRPELTENAQEAFRLYGSLLEKIRDLCSENDARLLLLITPAKVELPGGSEEVRNPDGTIVFGGGGEEIPPGRVSKIVAALAEKMGISTINFYDLMSSKPDPNKFYLSSDFHFNRKGHEFIADGIRIYLNQNGNSR